MSKRKTWEEKKERIEKITAKMDKAINSYFETPEQMKEYLSFMSKFYQYSPHNISLIQSQFQGAKAVGSFRFWQEKGFSVKKGEKGIEVLVPNKTVPKFKDENGKWKNIKYATKMEKEKIEKGELEQRKGKLYFSIGHVFDISQTTAKSSDLPEIFPNRWMEGNVDNYDVMMHGLHKVAGKLNVTVGRPFEELGAAKGAFYYAIKKEGKGHIGLNPRNSELQNVKTMIHELAHAKLHHAEHENHHNLTDVEKEFQAEMTAYTVASYFGIDTSDYSLQYLSNWTKGKELKDKSKLLSEVREVSVEFIETMEEVLVKEREHEKAAFTPESKQMKKLYWYEMLYRPVGIGCQPSGFLDWNEEKGAHGVIAYDRPLTEEELYEYEMKEWKEKEPIQMKEKEEELEKV